jgi:flagellar biosynthesis/type III secretory pathway M-ring protein FliF/YscJ
MDIKPFSIKQRKHKMDTYTKNIIKGWITAIAITLLVIMLIMWLFPKWNVYRRELRGKAALIEAQSDRKVQIEEAKANLESEKLNAKSEVERAKGAAEAIEIEGGNLTENYIRYLWVRNLETSDKQLIYVPTEAGLPLLEANRKP